MTFCEGSAINEPFLQFPKYITQNNPDVSGSLTHHIVCGKRNLQESMKMNKTASDAGQETRV